MLSQLFCLAVHLMILKLICIDSSRVKYRLPNGVPMDVILYHIGISEWKIIIQN